MFTAPLLERRRFLASLGALAAAPSLAKAPARYAAVQALADRYVAEKKLAGMSFAIATDGMPVSYINAGTLAFDSAARVDENSLWRVYSMTKTVTGAAAALLIEDGKLSLDQPISEFLPAWREPRVAIDPKAGLDSRPASKPITVRHLLTHTSGISYSISGAGPVQKALAKAGLHGSTNIPKPFLAQSLRVPESEIGDYAPSLRAFADRLATVPLIAEPGSVWHYSLGLDLLGAVIEVASGTPFDAFLKTRFFDPLDMRSTAFHALDRRRLTTNYLLTPKGPAPLDTPAMGSFNAPPPFPMGGAGLVSSARDFFRFGDMLRQAGKLGRARVMQPETVRLIHSDVMPAGVRYTDGGGYGFGGRVVAADTKDPNDSIGSYGWGGAAGTLFVYDPVKRSVIVAMAQYMPAEAYPLRKDLRAALAQG